MADETRPRPVVVHYHLFKNAGTSLDRTLRDNFGPAWVEKEAEPGGRISSTELAAFLDEHRWIGALSSHTTDLPAPALPGVDVIPVVFVRHPLDRIRSVYDFERRQGAETPGARKARETDIGGYIEWRLERARSGGDSSAANFQTHRLAKGGAGSTALERALDAVEALPFIGLVEHYGRSIARLAVLLSIYFPRVRLQAFRDNPTATGEGTLDERIGSLRKRIGDDLFHRLSRENEDDLALWETVRDGYEA